VYTGEYVSNQIASFREEVGTTIQAINKAFSNICTYSQLPPLVSFLSQSQVDMVRSLVRV
jgi:hypothetical protein